MHAEDVTPIVKLNLKHQCYSQKIMQKIWMFYAVVKYYLIDYSDNY